VFLGVGLLFRGGAALDQAPPAPILVTPCLTAGVVLLFVSAGLFLYLLLAYDDSLHWQRVFRLLGATLIVPVLGGCCLAPALDFGPSPWPLAILALCVVFAPPILLLVATFAAVIADFRRHEARDFWHWLGVATFLGAPAHFVITVLIEDLSP
jgi:hypothetical protein